MHGGQALKILFVMHNQGFVPYYESTLRLLAERGHSLHLAFNQPFQPDEYPLAEMVAAGAHPALRSVRP